MVDPSTADEALGILRDGRERVLRETDREQVVRIATRSVAVMLWLGLRDLPTPALRRGSAAVLFVASVGWGVWQTDRTKVAGVFNAGQALIRERAGQRTADGKPEPMPWREQLRLMNAMLTPRQKRALAVSFALSAARPVVIGAFRRSRVRYPHLAAGLVMGVAHATFGWLALRGKRESDAS